MSLLNSLAGNVYRVRFSLCQLAGTPLRQRTLLVVLTFFGFGTAATYADPGFITPLTFPAGPSPYNVAVADFNRDGKLDLAVTSYGRPGTLSILLGNGDGTFQAPLSYVSELNYFVYTSLTVGDFNGDGIPDLAVADSVDGFLRIMLGNGDGTFKDTQDLDTYGAFSVVVGDFNGDGHLDLAVTNANLSGAGVTPIIPGVSIWLGNGDGTFQAGQNYPTQVGAASLAVGDFNGDGHLDIVTSGGSLLLGNGDGTFQPAQSYGTSGSFVAVGDFNGDGKLDLAVDEYNNSQNSSFGTVSVLLGNGDGTFQGAQQYAAVYGALAVGDWNGDGKLDLATDGGSVLLGNGDGTFQPAQNYAFGAYSQSLAAADFNGDGHLDLVTSNASDATAIVLLGNGDGTFPAPRTYTVSPAPSSVGVGDFNGDGFPDLVVSGSRGSAAVDILLGNGDGTFQAAQNYPAQYGTLAVGDFNGDGHLDVVTSGGSVLLGNGDGTFQPAQSYGTSGSFVAIGDFNADGILDLAVTNSASVSVYLGNGDGTFRAANTYSLSDTANCVAVGDLNGDGIPDLAVATGLSYGYLGTPPEGNVFILLGNGDGTFTVATHFAAGHGPVSLAVGDFNGDGKQDLVTTNYAISQAKAFQVVVESDVRVYLGNGDGSFQAAQVYNAAYGPTSVAITDINMDGIPDLVIGNSGAKVDVLRGNGDGTFRAARSYPAGGWVSSVVVADFNGDGHPDVAVANNNAPWNPGGVTVLLNAADWGP